MRQSLISWGVFAGFVVCAVGLGWHDSIWRFSGMMGAAKGIVWATFLLFTAYSVYCSRRENIFKSIRSMAQLQWGRQVGIDLYLGLAFNESLALARALAVRDHLIKKHPTLMPTLSVKARGACCFIAANDTLAGRTQNRRVELVFDLHDKAQP